MKVAVAQLAPGCDPAQNLERSVLAVREAAERGAELVVLPELCLSPYQLREEPLDRWAVELPAGGPVPCWLREARALHCFLVAGLLERDGERYYNSAVVLGPYGILGCYRKAHRFSWERRLSAGDQAFLSVDIGRACLGVLVCYDLRFIEAVRLAALEGIELLCVPTTWTDIGKPHPWDQYGMCAAAHLAVGHAYANRIFVLCASRVGAEKGVRYLGNSLIAGPRGEFLAGPASSTETTVLVAEIDPREAQDKRIGTENDLFADRRTDLYGVETAKEVAAADPQESRQPAKAGDHGPRA